MAKEIKYNVEARNLLKEGVDALADAVKAVSRTRLIIIGQNLHKRHYYTLLCDMKDVNRDTYCLSR